MEKWQIFFFD